MLLWTLSLERHKFTLRPEGGSRGKKMPYSDFSICYRAGKNEQDAKNGWLI